MGSGSPRRRRRRRNGRAGSPKRPTGSEALSQMHSRAVLQMRLHFDR